MERATTHPDATRNHSRDISWNCVFVSGYVDGLQNLFDSGAINALPIAKKNTTNKMVNFLDFKGKIVRVHGYM